MLLSEWQGLAGKSLRPRPVKGLGSVVHHHDACADRVLSQPLTKPQQFIIGLADQTALPD